jgi:uncharacterized damage-inducible protein DinB
MTMSLDPLVIVPGEGYTHEVGRLVGMLGHTRSTTLRAVRDLSVEQLDHRFDARSNSIGMLLAHSAAVERAYHIRTFEHRDLSTEEQAYLGSALGLGPAAWQSIRGQPLSHYVDELAAVRNRTLESFRGVDDVWLDHQEEAPGGRVFNRYWGWFHVCEDELSHRGQIRWLRARLPAG